MLLGSADLRTMEPLDVREKVRLLPHSPGVYQFYDADGKILYVGKAKDLRNRVTSYFAKYHSDGKTSLLVAKIRDLRTMVVDTEFDALLLENSLIKQHQPRYNILLRDDKSFPFIRIRNEALPRVEGMRNPVDDGSEYFGPYAGVRTMKTVLQLTHKLYKLRTCNYDLSPKNIAAGKYKRCLEYHIGNCKGPCEGLQSAEEYEANIDLVRSIVKGRVSGVLKFLKEQMHVHADKLEFEQAEELREKIERLENYRSKSIVVNPDVGDVDVFGMVTDANGSYVNYLRVIDGAVVHGITIELKKRLEEDDQELLQRGHRGTAPTLPELRFGGHRTLRSGHRGAGCAVHACRASATRRSCWSCASATRSTSCSTSRSRNRSWTRRPQPTVCWTR